MNRGSFYARKGMRGSSQERLSRPHGERSEHPTPRTCMIHQLVIRLLLSRSQMEKASNNSIAFIPMPCIPMRVSGQ